MSAPKITVVRREGFWCGVGCSACCSLFGWLLIALPRGIYPMALGIASAPGLLTAAIFLFIAGHVATRADRLDEAARSAGSNGAGNAAADPGHREG